MFDGTTPLMTAVRLAVEEFVEQLLSCQVEVNATDSRGDYLSVDPSAKLFCLEFPLDYRKLCYYYFLTRRKPLVV